VATGSVKINRSRSFPTHWLVTINICKTKAENDRSHQRQNACIEAAKLSE
jgi:hypothetical protein